MVKRSSSLYDLSNSKIKSIGHLSVTCGGGIGVSDPLLLMVTVEIQGCKWSGRRTAVSDATELGGKRFPDRVSIVVSQKFLVKL
jgi:hypothetical protein